MQEKDIQVKISKQMEQKETPRVWENESYNLIGT